MDYNYSQVDIYYLGTCTPDAIMFGYVRFSGLVLMVAVEIHVGNQNVMFQPCSARPLRKGKHNTWLLWFTVLATTVCII